MLNNNIITVYKIQHISQPLLFYIGSTTHYNKRMHQHCYQVNNLENKLKIYESIRNNGGIDSFKFEIITEVATNDIQNKFILESHYIRTLNPPLNIQIPLRTQKQYYKDNIVAITEHKSKNNICTCGGRYRTDNLVHHIKTNKHKLSVQSPNAVIIASCN